MTYEESKNWKAPALQTPADLVCGAKDVGTTSSADQHPPKKVALAPEKSGIDARISHDISEQPYDGAIRQ